MGSVSVYFLVVTEGNGKSKPVQHQAGQLYTELVPKSCLSDSRQDPAPQCSGSMASLAVKLMEKFAGSGKFFYRETVRTGQNE